MRIQTLLVEAHNGQAIANLARAFHLAPDKVGLAVGVMIDDLCGDIHTAMRSPRSLAQLVDLLGQGQHEVLLDAPELLGATHTQVIGNEALRVIAGRTDSKRMARHAASFAGISEMIAEYLLPVIAAMVVGIVARSSRDGLATLARGGEAADAANEEPTQVGGPSLQLPRVSGGVGFAGSTGGSGPIGATPLPVSQYVGLADDIRRGRPPARAHAVRRVLEPIVGSPSSPMAWVERLGRWSARVLSILRR